MLDKYIRLFLEVSFADILKQVSDERELERKKAKEEKIKRQENGENDENMSLTKYYNLVNHGNTTTARRLSGTHSGKQKRPIGRS